MLRPSSNPILHNLGNLWPVIDFGVMRSCSDLAVSISLIHCNARVGFYRLRANFRSEIHNPALKFRVVREFSQDVYLRNDNLELSCHFEYKSQYPQHGKFVVDTGRFPPSRFFLALIPESKAEVLIAMVSSRSQFFNSLFQKRA